MAKRTYSPAQRAQRAARQRKSRAADPEKHRARTAKAVRKFRARKPDQAREQTRRAVARHNQREAQLARDGILPGDGAMEFVTRRTCKCGEPDPKTIRTLEKSRDVLSQRVECRKCGRRWTRVAELEGIT